MSSRQGHPGMEHEAPVNPGSAWAQARLQRSGNKQGRRLPHAPWPPQVGIPVNGRRPSAPSPFLRVPSPQTSQPRRVRSPTQPSLVVTPFSCRHSLVRLRNGFTSPPAPPAYAAEGTWPDDVVLEVLANRAAGHLSWGFCVLLGGTRCSHTTPGSVWVVGLCVSFCLTVS